MNSIKQKLLDTEEFVDNEYLIKYVDLITRNKNTLAQKEKRIVIIFYLLITLDIIIFQWTTANLTK